MHISPGMMEKAYELICETPPFKGWKLPPSDEVEFRTGSFADRAADYDFVKGHHRIRINNKWCGTVHALVKYMTHEMVHLKHKEKCPGDQSHHGREFNKLAKRVCSIHHIDPKNF